MANGGAVPNGRSRGSLSPYDELKKAISSGEFGPGFPLVELTLAESFGVSRTPIRQALIRLEAEGLVSRSERGLVVIDRSAEEVLDIYEVRILVAGLGARLAARRRSVLDLINLRTRLEALELLSPDDMASIPAANRFFLRALWKASHSTPVEETMDRLTHQILARYSDTLFRQPGRLEETLADHRELVEAVERRDEEVAARFSIHHFERGRDLRLRLVVEEQAETTRLVD